MKHLSIALSLIACFCTLAHADAPIAVTTWHYDYQHTGQDLAEKILTPRNVSPITFGKLFTQPIDGYAYAQPLYAPNVMINVPGGFNNGPHNVVFIATEHDSVYAFDADNSTGHNATPLWKRSFLDPERGIITVPAADVRSHDLTPEIGITGTPIIDLSTNTLYCVSKTKELRGSAIHYVQKLHALDISSGAEKFGGPVLIGDCHDIKRGDYENNSQIQYPGKGAGQDTFVDGRVVFNALLENQRPGLILLDGVVYVCWGSHGDRVPVHGWIVGFNAATLSVESILNTSPDGLLDTIWMGGSSPAVDTDGSIIASLGNGTTDIHVGGRDYGECLIKITRNPAGAHPWDRLVISDFFCPARFDELNRLDNDLGSGGPLLLPDQPGPHKHQLICAGKEGVVYVVDRDHMGGINNPPDGPDLIVETIAKNEIFADRGKVTASSINTAAYWQGFVYYTGHQRPILQIPVVNGLLAHVPQYHGNTSFDFPFPTPQISANGDHDGIVWLSSVGPRGALYAYDAANVSHELWNSKMAGTRDQYGATVKFAMPIIANGKVYAASQTEFVAMGLLKRSFGPLTAPTNLLASPVSSREIDLAWSSKSDNADGYHVERSADGSNFDPVGATGPKTTTFHDLRLTPHTQYWYRVYAINSSGRSDAAGPIQSSTKSALISDGLAGWWTFDEGDSNFASDLSSSNNEGHIAGEVSWIAGRVGDACLSFHGAGVAPGFVAIPNRQNLSFTATQSFTLTTWIDPANVPNKWCGWITHATEAGPTYGISTSPTNQWVFGTEDSPHNIAGGLLTPGWHYLAAVQDGAKNTRALYLDGQPIATGHAADASGTGDLWIGGAKNDTEQFVDGSIDDVRIYDRALSADEITQLAAWHNPSVPTIDAAAQSDGIHLTFGNHDFHDDALRIERSIDGGDWSDLTSIDQPTDEYVDHVNSTQPATYRYRARSTTDAGSSPYSPVVQVQTGGQ
jgi:large repetitive protein